MSNYFDASALCPYFIKEEKGEVHCEAGRIKAKDKEMRKELVYGRCAGNWQQCQFGVALANYYERKEKETFN